MGTLVPLGVQGALGQIEELGFVLVPIADESGLGKELIVLRAAYEQDLDLSRSWMVGRRPEDMDAGRKVRVATLLLSSGSGTEWLLGPGRQPDYVACDVAQAARVIRAVSSRWPIPSAQPRAA